MTLGTRFAFALAPIGALVLLPAPVGYAASVSGLNSSTLSTQHGEGTFVASVHDSFASGGKTPLAGRMLPTGQVWSAPEKPFECQAGSCYTTKNNLGLSMATLPWMSIPTTRVTSTLTSNSTEDFGLLIHADYSSTTAVAMRLMTGDVVQLARVNAGSWNPVATATAAPNATWSLTYDHGTYSISRNGSVVISYAATSSQIASWTANGDVGIYAAGDKVATWTGFTVESP